MKRSEFKYYVIQFLELPYEDINEYVCVPWSWIVIRRQIDQKVMVSYPVESPSETARRVKKRQKRSLDWKLYMSDVKYGTDLYQNALIYIEGIMDDVHYEHKGSNMMNRDQKSAMVKKKTRRPKKNAKSNHEIDKPQNLVVSSKNDDKSATKRLKRTALPNLDTQVALKRSKVVESAEPVSEAAEQPCQAFECSNENQSSPTHEDFSIQNSYTSEIPVEESDDRSCVNETEHVENSIQERPSVIQNSLNLTNSLSNPNKIIANPAFSTELFTVLRSLHTVCANSYSMIDLLRRRLIENTEALNDVKKLVVDIRSSSSDIQTASPSTNTTVEVERISTTRRSKQKQQDDEYDDHDDDDDDNDDDDYDDDDEVPLAKTGKKNSKRCCKRKFVLPPEYDENDSRWTLKYRELSPGLVELMPHTNVYVNSVQLSNCKRLSKDCKSLARLLLVEIFTKNALTVCSLTGSRARAYDDEGAVVRPGLDENARIVLLTFVEEYGREKSWITLDTQSIQNSIRNKMQEFRFKYG